MSEEATTQGTPAPRKFWSSRVFKLALAVTLIGAGLWVYALATAPEPPPPSASPMSGVSGFVVGGGGPAGAGPATAERRFIDAGAPATFRLGASFMAGYFIAWALRTFVKATLIVGGAAALAVLVLHKTGALGLDWAAIERHVEESLAWTRGQAEHLRTFATGYLPSVGAAAVGGFFGIRRA
jgi:uncharacterized membrane protein (Fun14 family)